MRLTAAIRHDLRFQFRHGFYYAYLLVTVLYVVLLRILPESIRGMASVLVIFSDPAALGCFFIGGIVLLEKGQNTLESLFVTPLRLREYLAAKVASLAVLAVASSVAIVLLAQGIPAHPGAFLTGVILSSVFFTLTGCILAARARDVNGYLLSVTLYLTVLSLPVLDYLGVAKSVLFYAFPTQASLVLLDAGFQSRPAWELWYGTAVLLAWSALAYTWAYRRFRKYVIGKGGDKS